jgi:hypothetical protein
MLDKMHSRMAAMVADYLAKAQGGTTEEVK